MFFSLIYPIYYRRKYILYRADLNSSFDQIKTKKHPFTIRLIEEHEIQLLEQIVQMEEWLDPFFKKGGLSAGFCLAALDGSVVAGFNLVNLTRIRLPTVNYESTLRRGSAFSEQITVNRLYRGKGLGTALRYETMEILKKQGCRRLYGGTDASNHVNLALSKKVGLKSIANIHYQKVLWTHRTTIRRHSNQ